MNVYRCSKRYEKAIKTKLKDNNLINMIVNDKCLWLCSTHCSGSFIASVGFLVSFFNFNYWLLDSNLNSLFQGYQYC